MKRCMKKKVICGLLGLTVLCSGLYWFFKDKETETIPDLDEDDECDVPHIWGEPLDEIDDFNGDVIIHFLDGRKQKINL